MFSKSSNTTAAPQRPAAGTSASNNRSVFAPDLQIVGDVSTNGTVEVLGQVEGTIAAHHLTIGIEGSVQGQVAADTIDVKGKLDGRADANSFTLRAASQVVADVSYTSLVIESGGQIEGRFSRTKTD